MQIGKMAGMMVAMMMGTAMQAEPLPSSFSATVTHSRVMNAGYLVEASKLYSALPPESRKVLVGHLDELARLPATADGVGTALSLLSRQVAGFPQGDQPQEGSGRSAGQQAMHSAGMCFIHGRIAQVADETKNSPQGAMALVHVIHDEQTLSDRDRGLLLRELERSFGRELYAKVLKEKSSRKGPRQ